MTTDDPIALFAKAFEQAKATEPFDPTAAALATADAGGRPSVRMVLLKAAEARGFSFFTNYGSRKARELEENPRAALCFYWASSATQVRVEGRVERLPEEESAGYFATRPRGSQIAAWASRQSAPIASRDELEARVRVIDAGYADQDAVPRPPFWGGYLLVPERIELWYGRENRLHDRIAYLREAGGWRAERLQP